MQACKNVWVGNLPFNFTNESLKYMFEYYGNITSVRTVPSPKGMGGLVQFSDPYAAATAIAALNGAMVDGQILVVRMANKEPGVGVPPLDAEGNLSCGGTNIWAGNLPMSFTERNLESIFQPYGTIVSVKMLQTPSALGDTAGLVNFSSGHEAAAAIQALNGSYLPNHGKPLMVKYAANQSGHNDNTELGNSPNVWVGNVPLNYNDSDLGYLFNQFGTVVSSKIVMNRNTGTSDGAGLVNFSTPQEAINAINTLNGVTPEGFEKPLILKHAKPVGSSLNNNLKNSLLQNLSAYGSMGNLGNMFSQLGGGSSSTNLWVGNLPSSYSENDLHELFKMCGSVSSIKVLQGSLTGHIDGACLVNFSTPAEAQNAQSMLNGLQLPMHDKALVVRPAKAPGSSGAQTGGALQSLLPQLQLQMQMGNNPLSNLSGMGGMMGGRMGGMPGARMDSLGGGTSTTNLWIGNLPPSYTEADINMLFGTCGTIVSSVILRDKATGISKKSAMVQYSKPEEAQAAVASINGFRADPNGLPIVVKYAANASKNSPQAMNPLAALQRTVMSMGRGGYGQGFHPYAR